MKSNVQTIRERGLIEVSFTPSNPPPISPTPPPPSTPYTPSIPESPIPETPETPTPTIPESPTPNPENLTPQPGQRRVSRPTSRSHGKQATPYQGRRPNERLPLPQAQTDQGDLMTHPQVQKNPGYPVNSLPPTQPYP